MNAFRRFAVACCRGIVFGLSVFVFLLGDTGVAASSYVSPFLQRVWQSDQGLPHDSVQALVQTRDGYLWIGTRRGVERFDGTHFVKLEMPGATRENISSLREDRNGNLWIGTAKGVARFKDGKVSLYGPVDGVPEDDVRTLYEDKQGSVWIGRAGGLTQYKDGKFRNFTNKEGLPSNVVRSIIEDDAGTLWIATDNGLCCMKDGIISTPEMAKPVGRGVRVIAFDSEKNLWAGTQAGLFKRTESGWEHFDKNQNGLSDDFIDMIYSDRTGKFWIGTYGGLNRWVDGKFVTELTSEGTPYDLVNCMLEDREGDIWIGSKEGLARLKIKPFSAITKQHGLTHNNVMSVLEDRTGTVWCGTWGGGLFQLKDEKMVAFAITNRVSNNRILSLCNGRDGSLWFGTDHGDGLYRLKDGILTHYGDEEGLERIGIPVIYEDHAGQIWIGTSRSLSCLKDGKFVRYTTKDGLVGDTVKVILADKEGDLWIGTTAGLSLLKNGKFTNFTIKEGLSHNAIFALHADNENNLWIGTGGGGLNRLRKNEINNPTRQSSITSYTSKRGLFNDDVLEILEDDNGYLWMTCLKGIFRVSKKALDRLDRGEISEIPCASYGKDDGMISIICSNVAKPGGWKSGDGRLWFATTKGVVVADPKFKVNDAPPPVVIDELLADKKAVGCDPTTKLMIASSSFSIPAGRGELEFHYAALSFPASEKNRFKYKLAGVDPDWVEAGTRRVAYYNNIGPGSYLFHVIACNNDGVWTEHPTKLEVILLPHFWQTKVFTGLVLFIAVGCVAGAVRFVTWRKLETKIERMERQNAVEKERSRIAQDMHDELGARLTEIRVLSNLTEKSKDRPEAVATQSRRVSNAAGELIDNLHSIVWAVNPTNDSLEKLADYIRGFAQPFLQSSSIRCRFDCPTHLPDLPLSSEVRHNIFLSVKEALNNVVKHADASEVRISLSVTDSKLVLSIVDNGRGFQTGNTSAVGNGLQNMERRLQNVKGHCVVLTAPCKGTTIRFEILI
ncbi:MAG: putative two-component system sensor kinase [Verrucomicrobiales bacterium]|nr:putative two-component system sensor kinase [Verrucomicrobiales bacterium]